jgi:hypothetical protein
MGVNNWISIYHQVHRHQICKWHCIRVFKPSGGGVKKEGLKDRLNSPASTSQDTWCRLCSNCGPGATTWFFSRRLPWNISEPSGSSCSSFNMHPASSGILTSMEQLKGRGPGEGRVLEIPRLQSPCLLKSLLQFNSARKFQLKFQFIIKWEPITLSTAENKVAFHMRWHSAFYNWK